MTSPDMTTLAELKPSQRGTVTDVDASQAVSQRLTMLGVLPGVGIEMIRSAPLGDPITFRVNGQEFSLRRADAAAITIKM